MMGALTVLVLSMSAAGATFSIELVRPMAEPVKSKPARPAAPALEGTGIIRWNPEYPHASGYNRFAYVLVSRFDAGKAARLPGTSLVYMSGTSIDEQWSNGVTYREAIANDWLLKDDSGAYVMNVLYGAFVADIGSPSYQQRFIQNTIAFMKRTKVDGIFLDDVLGDPRSMSGVYPAKYPDTAAWESAMVSFVHAVGTALKSRGYYVLANATKYIGDDSRSDTGEHVAEFWKRLAPGVSALMSEFWLQNPNDHRQLRALGSKWHEYWRGWQSLVSVAQSRGVDFFGLTYGSDKDTRTMRYARASFLLDWHGRGGALVYYKSDDVDPYHSTWVRQLGKPLQPKFERASGIWQRRYERGMVVVNATNAPIDVRVFGKSFTIASADALFVRAAPS